MLTSNNILFKKGEILNSKMLEELQKLSNKALNIKYYEYSDGIIKGLDFYYDENTNLFLTPGILKFKKKIYFLEEPVLVLKKEELTKINSNESERRLYITLKERSLIEECSIEINSLEIDILESENLENIFLGSFVKRENIYPEVSYENLENFSNSSYIDIIQRKYSDEKKPTISPLIIKVLSEYFLKIEKVSSIESYIMFRGMEKNKVSLEILGKYLDEKLETLDFKLILEKLERKLQKKPQIKTVEQEREKEKIQISPIREELASKKR